MDQAPPTAEIDTFEAFLQASIKDYYASHGKSDRARFIALLLASGQIMSLAKDSMRGGEGVKKAAIGAAAVVALRLALRWALAGPLGILLTGLTAVSLVAFLVKNQKDVLNRVERYKQLIAETRTKFDEIQSGYRGNRYDARERHLMVDGLQKRFLTDCDEV